MRYTRSHINLYIRGIISVFLLLMFVASANSQSLQSAVSAYKQQNYRRATALATGIIKKDSRNMGARWIRGTSLFALGNADTSLADLGLVENAWFTPGKTTYNFQTLSYLLADGTKATGNQSIQIYYPLIAYSCFQKAELNFQAGQFSSAYASFDHAVNLQPNVQAYKEGRAQAMYRQGKFEAAANEFQSMARDSANTRRDYLYAMAGRAWQKTGDYKRSLTFLDTAIYLNESVPDYYFTRGFSKLETRQPYAAMQDLQIFIDANPDDLEGLYALGRAQHGAQEYDAAILTWKRIQRINGGYQDTWAQMAGSMGEAGDWAQAILAYDKAIASDGQQPIYYYNRAVAKKMLNRPKEEICLDLRKAATMGNLAAQRLVTDYGCGF